MRCVSVFLRFEWVGQAAFSRFCVLDCPRALRFRVSAFEYTWGKRCGGLRFHVDPAVVESTFSGGIFALYLLAHA